MHELGIEFISVFGLPPVEFVHLAADLGCRYISIALTARRLESLGYPAFSLKDDVRLRRDLLAAMDDRGVGISLGEGMVITAASDVCDLASDLDIMAALGPLRSTASASTRIATARSTSWRCSPRWPPSAALPTGTLRR